MKKDFVSQEDFKGKPIMPVFLKYSVSGGTYQEIVKSDRSDSGLVWLDRIDETTILPSKARFPIEQPTRHHHFKPSQIVRGRIQSTENWSETVD